jgi:hypothetical protein
MDSSQIEKLIERIDSYPEEYIALKHQAKKYIQNNSNIDDGGTLNVFHRPWVAPFNWGMRLYQPAGQSWIEQFQQRTHKVIPDFYKKFLLAINGCFIYDLSLFGLTPSMYTTGTLNRSILQCTDLTTANNTWIVEYKIDSTCFHFGGRAYTYSENIGYFFTGTEIKSLRKNGNTIKSWTSFSDFLTDEVMEAENMMAEEIPKNTKILITG